MLSNIPDWMLIRHVNDLTQIYTAQKEIEKIVAMDYELDSRYPEDQYGDYDNQLEFLPTEPEWDDRPVEDMEYEDGISTNNI